MVYLHNVILCSREKEGAYTLHNSVDETGDHCLLLKKKFTYVDLREKETLICCSTYLCILWLLIITI